MKVIKRGMTLLISIILWAIILIAALFVFTTLTTRDETHVASLVGFSPMIVESDSMAPTFYEGDLIFIKKCNTSELREGDIITFHTIINNEYALNTHRIHKIEGSGSIRSYTTKGDNNQIADTHVISDGDIVGRYVSRLAGFGRVMKFLSSGIGFLVVIILPLLLFFIYQIYNLIMISVNLKKAIAAEEARSAQETLEEAKRLKAEAEAQLAEAEKIKKKGESHE